MAKASVHARRDENWTICGAVAVSVETSASSDGVTCSRCRKAVASGMPSAGRNRNDSLWDALVLAKVADAASADRRREAVARFFDEEVERVAYVLRSALENVDRVRARVARRPHAAGTMTTVDYAAEVQGQVAFVASNVRTGSLFRAAVDLDAETRRVVDAVHEADARAVALSLGTWQEEVAR